MARLKRVTPAHIPLHIIQRGNNREVCFASESDMKAYLKWLSKFSVQYEVSIHAHVLMTNHVHLLCTSKTDTGISKMMQSLGRMYVGYFNYHYKRTGTLWEGRYKSSVVDSRQYLLQLYRYIELNPVRAGMVTHPGEYTWSSYAYNALGISNTLNTPHEEYLNLGKDDSERSIVYKEFCTHITPNKVLTIIRKSINKGLALGSEDFIQQVETLTKLRVSAKKAGRPKKR